MDEDEGPWSAPEWRTRGDLVARAVRLMADGVVEHEGLAGLARRLGCSPRHLDRRIVAELGAPTLALVTARRARTARFLVETTDLPMGDVAVAAGFAGVRQLDRTMRDAFGSAPTEMRRRSHAGRGPGGDRAGLGGSAPSDSPARPAHGGSPGAGHLTAVRLRLAARRPFAHAAALAFVRPRALPGVEVVHDGTVHRSLRLAHGEALVSLTPRADGVDAVVRVGDLRDLIVAVARCRRLFDLDTDPVAVDAHLGRDAVLGPLVAATPGLRAPGGADPFEQAVRIVVGQRISVAAASTVAGRLVCLLGEPVEVPVDGVTRTFPTPETVAEATDTTWSRVGVTRAQVRALRALASAVATGAITLDRGADRAETAGRLARLPGVGPWTVAEIMARSVGDPDAFPATDLGVRRSLAALGLPVDAAAVEELSAPWRPWRAYAVAHLWHRERLR